MAEVWQISGGWRSRSCAGLFLDHGVALIGPGDAGARLLERDGTVAESWPKVATPRGEVRGGRSFPPEELAIGIGQASDRTASIRVPTFSAWPVPSRRVEAVWLAAPR